LHSRGGPRPTEEVVEAKKQELLTALKEAGIVAEEGASPKLNQYYPPFAPRFIRLQDVLLPVKE